MLEKLARVEQRYEELNTLLSDPAVASDYIKATEYGQERAELEEVVRTYQRCKHAQQELDDTRSMMDEDLSSDLQELAQEEVNSLEQEIEGLMQELQVLLLPKDPNDDKNVIVEIRAGTGGDEAA
ncbi:MAG TPA: PCRF domain-containing protein, partial [Anaerolineae bacterium]|nr:PCRF domain-containing protein [Anaerolineae bacterium]